MKGKTLKFPLFFFCIALAFFSCRKNTPKVIAEWNKTDSIYSIGLNSLPPDNQFELTIHNPSPEISEFYITPRALNFFSDSTVINTLLKDGMSDKEKCIALWKFICEWTFHAEPLSESDQQINDPAALLNAFENGICDDRNAALCNLARMAGIPARVYRLTQHLVAELYYDSSWHMFDADKHLIYTLPEGNIASVAYLHQHPEIMDRKNEELSSFFERVRNRRTKASILSTDRYDSTSYYDIGESVYSSAIRLKGDSRLTMKIEPVGFFRKMISISLLKRNGPFYKRQGTLSHSFLIHSDTEGSDTTIYTEALPYPIQQITVTTSQNYLLYYSYNGKQWHFKGTTGKNASAFSFIPFNEKGEPFVFKYHLKLIAADSNNLTKQQRVNVESKFTFSDKILINNPEHAFRVMPLNKTAQEMKVRFLAVE